MEVAKHFFATDFVLNVLAHCAIVIQEKCEAYYKINMKSFRCFDTKSLINFLFHNQKLKYKDDQRQLA